MSVAQLVTPSQYGLVLLTASGTFVLSTLHSLVIGAYFRGRTNVRYPRLYATEEEAAADPAAFAYNCAQRAHANYLENLVPMTGSMLVAGLRFPRLAAGLGLGWSICRIIYFYNYTRAEFGKTVHGKPPPGIGTLFWYFQFMAFGAAGKAAWDIFRLGV